MSDWKAKRFWKTAAATEVEGGFGVALAGLFIVIRLQTGMASLTAIIMLAIPLTIIGIMPGFWLLNVITSSEHGGYSDPVLFTATAMIGMIALAGIIVRNSILLVDFINQERRRGISFEKAVVMSAAVRAKPIVLTGVAAMAGAFFILDDPIFSGLAVSLISGILVSTLLTLVVIPVVYYAVMQKRMDKIINE